MRVLDIMRGTTVDGPGFRTSVYLAGCLHRCPGCHNPQSWDFDAGAEMSVDEVMEIVREENFDVTLSGGDPLYHPEEVTGLCRQVRAAGHTVWLYTGFSWEEIVADPVLAAVMEHVDVVVDGPYCEALRDTDLLFRGSSNQRLIDVKKSLAAHEVVGWHR